MLRHADSQGETMTSHSVTACNNLVIRLLLSIDESEHQHVECIVACVITQGL